MTVATAGACVTSPRAPSAELPSDSLADRVIFRRRRRPGAPHPFTLGEDLADRYEVELGPNCGAFIAEQALAEAADLMELLDCALSGEIAPDPALLPRVLNKARREMRLALELAGRIRDAWQTPGGEGFTAGAVLREGETDAA